MTYAEAFEELVAAIKRFEGCHLRAYPDPASPLYRKLADLGILKAYMAGKVAIPEIYRTLSGKPWTIGYGETLGVREGLVWTQKQADAMLRHRVGQFLLGTLKRCPMLHLEPPERWVACVDLAYNIGLGAFGASSVCRKTNRGEFDAAAQSFLLWNKAGGRVLRGLTLRRQWERATYQRADR